MRTNIFRFTVLLLTAAVASCDTPVTPFSFDTPEPSFATVPPSATATTLDFGTWNVEWFGHTSNGPSNEALQLQNVQDVISGADLDIWGLQEVVGDTHFADLVAGLPGYAGLLANDPSMVDGPAYYNGFGGTEQKVALVYKTSIVTLQSARVILTAYDYEFAGRPPWSIGFP